jgi:tRNA (guanine37-N1)-methyltransferase
MALSRPALQNFGRFPRLTMNSTELPEIFRPPVNRSMRVLDRSFFQKTLPIAAATVFEDRDLSTVRGKVQNAGNLLGVFSIKAVVPDETVPGRKCVLLRPGIQAQGGRVAIWFSVPANI